MTILDKLLGRPENLEGLLDKAHHAGITLIRIDNLTWRRTHGMLDGENKMRITGGPYTLNLKTYQRTFIVDGGESCTFSSAYDTAKWIAHQGFAVDVLGMDLQQAEQKNEELYRKWQAGLRNYGEIFQSDF